MLRKRGMPLMTAERYREIFRFPVREYYEEVGFDFSVEKFERPAEEFIDEYNSLLHEAVLFEGAAETLKWADSSGIKQYVLSAMEQQALRSSVHDRNILPFFQALFGIQDNLAHSKLQRGKELLSFLKDHHNDTETFRPVLIGDSLHDHEVGHQLGIPVILVSWGHQHPDRLKSTNRPVVNSFSELQHLMFV